MPAVTVTSSQPTTTEADALVLGVRPDDDPLGLSEPLKLLGFTGKPGSVTVVPSNGAASAPLVVAVGLAAEPSPEDLRRAAANAVRAVPRAATVALDLSAGTAAEVAAVAEGALLAAYRYERFKAAPAEDEVPPSLETAVVVTDLDAGEAEQAVTTARTVVEAVALARDWVNCPPGDLRPPQFADEIAALDVPGLAVTVWDEATLSDERCGGILGVGQGSDAPPRLVRLELAPEGATKHLTLVGKGITFDSGGLSIKPGASMQTMKCDMAGAAAIVAATVAIARLGLPIKVTAFACLAENMPGGSATRPGDVLTMRSGKTVEVHNTDAEGRLVLADGLALATELEPDLVVDVATLTGAAIVALGERTAGVLTNDDALGEQVLDAAKLAGEPMWPLPIPEEVAHRVHTSSIADLRQHNPKPAGGTLFAAAFLREFVGETPWAHLDIAGPAFNEGGAFDYTPVGGTGAGVRTLVRLAEHLTA
ncbi:leucyl aminopeptidase [Aeromicrobium sp. IC_218]|uniref:leucyl aminopeptidase n=1 Tax=Aeromicrobium sp. IC_218 TaxID=2545468 RepID=UPI00103B7C56|nr:leucyl aminopeptidase [Aeromicrobium sp. IC_218]TCI99713.1 leucyl aminopeptidase [Aeromicrobium sp. IC_218]